LFPAYLSFILQQGLEGQFFPSLWLILSLSATGSYSRVICTNTVSAATRILLSPESPPRLVPWLPATQHCIILLFSPTFSFSVGMEANKYPESFLLSCCSWDCCFTSYREICRVDCKPTRLLNWLFGYLLIFYFYSFWTPKDYQQSSVVTAPDDQKSPKSESHNFTQ